LDASGAYKACNRQYESCADETLAQRAVANDMNAFGELMQRYKGSLFGYICRMVSNRADAEDLFQETFIQVYKNLKQYRSDMPFRPWLYGIATNRCRDHFRKRNRRPQEVSWMSGINDEQADSLERVEANTPSPAELAIAHETAAQLEQALMDLPEKQRAVFLMARYHDMSYRDIALTLHIPEGTVKSRMHNAVNFLLTRMEKSTKS